MTILQAGVQPANPARVSDDYREFVGIIDAIKARPDAEQMFSRVMRACRRAGLADGEDVADAKLLATWDAWKAAVGRIEDVGSADSAYEYHIRARDEAEEVLLDAIATTPAGAAAKLRFALDMSGPPRWVSDAIIAGNDLTLFALADELSSDRRGIVDALALLVRPADTTVRDAFEAWVAAWTAWNTHLRDRKPDDEALRDEAARLETALAATPARTAEDMLFKLLPLAMNDHSSNTGPFALHHAPDADDDTLDGKAMHGLISGMLALSPRIAELVAMRWPPREPVTGGGQAFDRIANDFATTRAAVNGGIERDGGPIGDAYGAAADAMDQAVPTSFEQFARKFVCVHADGRPGPEIEQELVAQARQLLGDQLAEQAA